jgi:dihydroorotate dehydrogenase
MYQKFIRPLLFTLPPEAVHQGTLGLLRSAGGLALTRELLAAAYRPSQQTPVRWFGLEFPNRVGLAAGYDKDAQAVAGLAALGFGHIEVGTVTPKPQPGNPKPRLFRLPEDQAIINRLGFPGKGADYAARQLTRLRKPPGLVLGVNIGKNKDTPLNEAHQDYLFLIEKFAPLADYLAINISSPNTVGLRQLQHREYLGGLLEKSVGQRNRQQDRLGKSVPLLVKLAPDLTGEELDQIIDTILLYKIDGVIATNTTTRRENLISPHAAETGGLSGQPLKVISNQVIEHIVTRTGGKIPVIGVGGIASPEDAQGKLNAGASLVQLYSGLIYQGPGLIKQIIESTEQ